MKNVIQQVFTLGKLDWTPADQSASVPLYKLGLRLRYRGDVAARVFDFLTTAGSSKVRLTFDPEDSEGELEELVVPGVSLGKATLDPQPAGELQEVELPVSLKAPEPRHLIDLARWVMACSSAGITQPRIKMELEQPGLDYDGEGDGGGDDG